MDKKILAVIVVVIIVVVAIGGVAAFQVLNKGNQNPNSTPSPTPTPTASSTQTAEPTETATPTPSSSATTASTPSPTPLPSPAVTVAVTGSNYNASMGQNTQFDCVVTVNNHAYDSLMTQMLANQSITVTNTSNMQQVTGNFTTALQAILPQLQMNYGFSTSMTISNASNGQFTLTMNSDSATVLPGGIDVNTLGSALTSKITLLLAAQ